MTVKSTRQFKSHAERILRAAHPDASVAVTWTHAAKVTWHDGTAGYSGTLTAAAPGYKERLMVASFHDGGLAVR